SRDLKARMSKKRLQGFEPHSGIQELTCKGVPETVERVALVVEACLFQVFDKHHPCRGIGDAFVLFPVGEHIFSWVLFLQPGGQGFPGISAKIDNPSHPSFSRLMDKHLLRFEIDVLDSQREKLPYSHTRSQKYEHDSPVSDIIDYREKLLDILGRHRPRQGIRDFDRYVF